MLQLLTLSPLPPIPAEKIIVITNDGRNIIGSLKGFDHTINIVLEKSFERIFAPDAGVVVNDLGLHIIRGDNICLISELDEAEDAAIDYSLKRAAPIKPVAH